MSSLSLPSRVSYLPQQSVIPVVLSSLHGQERRSQRNITKRDLQAAVKYGKKEPGFPHPRTGEIRWKYSFGDIVYITDETSTKEVTSWALELPFQKVHICEQKLRSHEEAKRRVKENPEIITSHTVIVVDMSGSMRKSDMNGHRSRVRGVYYALAQEYLQSKLYGVEENRNFGPSLGYTDVVSVIEFHNEAEIIIECEPFSWKLFNDLVDLADGSRARDHGCYFEAIVDAFALLKKYDHNEECALNLFFLSDGKPSDPTVSRYNNFSFPEDMYRYIEAYALYYKHRLTFSANGFGKEESEFSILQEMVNCAKEAGTKGYFGFSYEDNSMLRSMLDLSFQSLTKTRSMLSSLENNRKSDRTLGVKVNVEQTSHILLSSCGVTAMNYDFFNGSGFGNVSRLQRSYDPVTHKPILIATQMQHALAKGFAVSQQCFGQGAERIAYYLYELDRFNLPKGQPMVAKLSLYKHKINDLEFMRHWHHAFLNIQHKAGKLGEKFNQRLNQLGITISVPRVMFLPCSIYEARNLITQKEHAYLVEERLNPENYRKWNDNAGKVYGSQQRKAVSQNNHSAYLLNDFGLHRPAATKPLDVITEEEEEDMDEDDDNSEGILEDRHKLTAKTIFQPSAEVLALQGQILEDDVPQAFSHFTYVFTKRELLVCDLQGELQYLKDEGKPIFKFTDPSIHCSKLYIRYGETDHGHKGMYKFLDSHKCNALCRLLKLPSSQR